jgi:hypothetical protein
MGREKKGREKNRCYNGVFNMKKKVPELFTSQSAQLGNIGKIWQHSIERSESMEKSKRTISPRDSQYFRAMNDQIFHMGLDQSEYTVT